MPGVNSGTKVKIIKNAGKPYYTPKGNTYMAIPLFDKKGKKHGHVIYMKTNLIENERPCFVSYEPLLKYERESEHVKSINGGKQEYIKEGTIAIDR